jgi:hypothetical protein
MILGGATSAEATTLMKRQIAFSVTATANLCSTFNTIDALTVDEKPQFTQTPLAKPVTKRKLQTAQIVVFVLLSQLAITALSASECWEKLLYSIIPGNAQSVLAFMSLRKTSAFVDLLAPHGTVLSDHLKTILETSCNVRSESCCAFRSSLMRTHNF